MNVILQAIIVTFLYVLLISFIHFGNTEKTKEIEFLQREIFELKQMIEKLSGDKK